MAKLAFKIEADYEKVMKLRQEIDKLKESLSKIDVNRQSELAASMTSRLKDCEKQYRSLGAEASKTGAMIDKDFNDKLKDTYKSVDVMTGSFAKFVGMLGGAAALKSFVSELISVRGEFKNIEVSLQTLLGNKEKADALMQQVKQYAAVSPLNLKDVASVTQMMLGFNIEAEKVPRFLQAIGDVSMGDAQRFQGLSLAFSQMSATGKLMGQDLLQMINAGFNPLTTIASKTGKSVAQLKEEMSKGAISAEMVQQAFIDATSAGGKFYNMSQNASKTLSGQISMLGDAWDEALNDMGTKSEGIMMGGVHAATALIENYETIGKVLASLIATYGVYRAAVILATVAENGYTVAEMINYNALLMVEKAQKLLNATMLSNPYVAAAVAVTALVSALWIQADAMDANTRGVEEYNKYKEDTISKENEHKEAIGKLLSVAEDEAVATEDRKKALIRLSEKYPAIFAKYKTETDMLEHLLDIKKQINAEDNLRSQKKQSDKLEELNKKIKQYGEGIKEASKSGAGMGIQSMQNELNKLKKERDLLQSDINKNKRDEVLSNLTGYSNKQLSAEIEARKKLIKKIETSEKLGTGITSGNVNGGIVSGTKSRNELEAEMQAFQRELEGRNKKAETTNKKYWEKRKNEAETARNALSDQKKNSEEWNKYTKQIEEAEKHIQNYSASTKSSKIKTSLSPDKKAEQDAVNKMYESLKSEVSKQQQDLDQAQIDMMKEGTAKKIAQIKLDYEKRSKQIKNEEDDYLKTLQEAEYKRWKIDNPDYKKSNKKFVPTITSLSDEQKKPFEDNLTIAREMMDKQAKDIYDSLFSQYQNYEQKRLDIANKYAQARTDIEASGRSTEEKSSAIAEIDKAEKEAMRQLSNDALSNMKDTNTFIVSLFKDTADQSTKQLEIIMAKTKILLEYMSSKKDSNGDAISTDSKGNTKVTTRKKDVLGLGFSEDQLKTLSESPEQLKAIKDAYDKIKEDVSKSNPFKMLASSISDLFSKGKDSDSLEKKLKNVGKSASDSADMISSFAGKLSDMLSAAGNDSAAQAASDVQDVANSVSNIGKGFAQGGIIGGIAAAAGEAISWATKAFAAEARHKAALKAIMNDIIAQQRAYNLLLMDESLNYKEGSTIFGTDLYAKALNAVNVYKRAVLEVKNQINSLNDIELITGHKKTGLFGWGKGKDLYTDILQVYPDLIDANGKFNESLAETIISTRKMSEEDKAALQYMIDSYKEQEKALDELKSYFESIFGDLGNSISDALADAAENGTDAFSAMCDSVGNMLEKLAKNMIYSVTIAPYIQKAQKDMLSVMQNQNLTDAEKFTNYADILRNLADNAITEQNAYTNLFNEYKKIAFEKGLDIFTGKSSQEASSKSMQSMSEDTGQELNGRFTALQMAGEEIKNQNTKQTDLMTSIDGNVKSILDMRIEDFNQSPTESSSMTNVADESRNIMKQSLESSNISFPTEAINSINNKISDLKDIVYEMRSNQADGNLNRSGIHDDTKTIVKQNKEISSKLDDARHSLSKL